jgi:arginase family enzyme
MPGGDEVQKNLTDWAQRRRAAVIALAQNWAAQLEGQAKDAAPWKDRTSNARNGLLGKAIVHPSKVVITLGHSIEYGIFLELARQGKYAILKPTIDKNVPAIYDSYKKLWS